VVDLVLAQRLDDAVGVLAGLEALDRAAGDRLVLLAEGEQGPQCHQDVAAAGSAQPGQDGENIVAGDFPQVAVAA
jgi:hypothetical protein